MTGSKVERESVIVCQSTAHRHISSNKNYKYTCLFVLFVYNATKASMAIFMVTKKAVLRV